MYTGYSAPLQSYDSTLISPAPRNSPATKEKLGTEITPQMLDEIQKKSIRYFSKELNASKFRLRIPDDRTAKFNKIVDTKYQDIRSSVNQSLFFTRAQPLEQYSLRHIAVALRNKKYDEVRLDVDKLYNASMQQTSVNPNSLFNQQNIQQNTKLFLQQQQMSIFQSRKHLLQQQMQQGSFLSIASVYSYLATILKGNYELESAALRQMEHIQFPAKDLPHFIHLLDELLTLPDNEHALLSSFFLNDVTPLVQAFKNEPHPMPLISCKPVHTDNRSSSFLRDAFRSPALQNMAQSSSFNFGNILTYNLSLNINDLMQLAERLELYDPKPTPVSDMPKTMSETIPKIFKQVPELLLEGKYIDCIRFATTLIEAGVKVPEMHMYRSLAYYKINRIPEAIIDMTTSIDHEPTPEKFNARAGFWLITGNQKLAANDQEKAIEL